MHEIIDGPEELHRYMPDYPLDIWELQGQDPEELLNSKLPFFQSLVVIGQSPDDLVKLKEMIRAIQNLIPIKETNVTGMSS